MKTENVPLDDVPARFGEIPAKVRKSPLFGSRKKYLGARNYGAIPWPDYTSTIHNELGLGEHIQGIQRIDRFLILSAGVKTGLRRSQLIVIEMGSRTPDKAWALPQYKHNGFNYENPAPNDRITTVVDIDPQMWHAGGIQASGEIIAVPIYGGGSGSEIRYFDFSDPAAGPVELAGLRLGKSDFKAKAVAITRLPDDYYMTMAWDDENLDFHQSNSTDLSQGFAVEYCRKNRLSIQENFQPGGGGASGAGTYQSLNFVRGADGDIYLVAMRNKEKASPTFTGSDFADLYQIRWPNGYRNVPDISLVKHRTFYCYNQQANFGAAAGIFAADHQRLYLYGASHWLHGGNARYNFNEYSRC